MVVAGLPVGLGCLGFEASSQSPFPPLDRKMEVASSATRIFLPT